MIVARTHVTDTCFVFLIFTKNWAFGIKKKKKNTKKKQKKKQKKKNLKKTNKPKNQKNKKKKKKKKEKRNGAVLPNINSNFQLNYINEDIQEKPQSRSTVFIAYRKKRLAINKWPNKTVHLQ